MNIYIYIYIPVSANDASELWIIPHMMRKMSQLTFRVSYVIQIDLYIYILNYVYIYIYMAPDPLWAFSVCIYIYMYQTALPCAYCQRYCSCTTLTTLTKAVILCMPETCMKTYLWFTLYYMCMNHRYMLVICIIYIYIHKHIHIHVYVYIWYVCKFVIYIYMYIHNVHIYI